MNKKGQITIFVIVAILIIVAISAFLVFQNKTHLITGTSLETQAKSFVENCIQSQGNQALFILGLQGGHIALQNPYFSTTVFNTSYLYYNGANMIPSSAEIENELSSVMNKNIETCANFSSSPALSSYSITSGKINTAVKIRTDDIIMDVNWPMTLKKGDASQEINSFSAVFPIALNDTLNKVKSIVLMEQTHPDKIDNFFLLNLYSNITFSVYGKDSTVVYLIKDEYSKINNQSYEFLFANKLNLTSV